MTDPFRARTKPSAHWSPETAEGVPPRTDGEPSRAELEDMRRADLVALAKQRGVDANGTKAELIARLAA